VSRQDRGRTGGPENVKRVERLRAVGGRGSRDDLRPAMAGIGVERDERIAGDERASRRKMQGAVPVRMPRREQNAGTPRNVKLLAGSICLKLLGSLDAEGAGGAHRGEDADEARIAHEIRQPAAFVVITPRVVRDRYLRLVDPHRDTEFSAGTLGEPHVIKVAMRQHDGVNISHGVMKLGQRSVKRAPGGRMTGINDRQTAVVLNDEPVDVRVFDAMDPFSGMGLQHNTALPRSRADNPADSDIRELLECVCSRRRAARPREGGRDPLCPGALADCGPDGRA
jgi:hypothetical protein